MKRSIRWYFAWGIMVAALSMLLFMVTAGPALAWTQETNEFTDTGSGSGWCSGMNGQDSSHPCVYWQEPHYTSISLHFNMDPSLHSSQSKGYDFNAAIYTAFTQYNNVAAWNPYMFQCFTFCQGIVGTYYMTTLLCGNLAHTSYFIGDVKYGYNPYRGGNEWYAFFISADVQFSNSIFWNNSFDWTQTSCSNEHADGRAAATHESGHVQGLGHTGDFPSVMSSACLENGHFYQLSTNSDIPAIKAIYRGDQQSS
ncbi:MAG TPA: matrixin family metalloprotease [Ktedonobacterales bacterium]|jgi:hypothetical protein